MKTHLTRNTFITGAMHNFVVLKILPVKLSSRSSKCFRLCRGKTFDCNVTIIIKMRFHNGTISFEP